MRILITIFISQLYAILSDNSAYMKSISKKWSISSYSYFSKIKKIFQGYVIGAYLRTSVSEN